MTKSPIYPQDYLQWTGSIDDLVSTANEILRQKDLHHKDISVRTARHYQQTGMLGKGQRVGKSSVFSYADLATLVSAKGLIQDGWTIKHASSLLSSQTGAVDASLNSPVAMVGQMMHSAGLGGSLPAPRAVFAANASLSAPGAASFSATAVGGAVSSAVVHHQPVDGLNVYMDRAKIQSASVASRAHAADQLEQWATQLRKGTL